MKIVCRGGGVKNYKSTIFCPLVLALAVFFVFFSTSTRLDAAGFCLPGDDAPTADKHTPKAIDNALQKGEAYGFFDANPNMRGFLSKEAVSASDTVSYNFLMNVVPHVLSNISDKVRYQKITGTISPISSANILQVGTPEFYQCQRGIPLSECNRTKTHIDQLLALAASLPATSLFVLASDLSIDGNLLLDNKSGTIKSSLETIMQSGRAVGLLGFKMPFEGTIFTLPSGRRYTDAHSRPTFLLAIGARDKVLRFHKLLKKEFGTRWSDEDHNFLIFTDQLIHKSLVGGDWPEKAFKNSKGVRVDKFWEQASGFQQFTISKKHVGAIAEINLTEIQTPNSLPIKAFDEDIQLWQWRKESNDCKKSWLRLKRKEKMIKVNRKGSKFEFKLGGTASVVQRLPKRRKYFIRTEVTATDIGIDESLASWVSGWNFDERSEDTLFDSQANFFPALNLRRFVSQLESVTRSTFKPEIIARFDLGVSLER
jgi:hypothetical protein